MKREVPSLSQTISKWVDSSLPFLSPIQKALVIPFSYALKQALKAAQQNLLILETKGPWNALSLLDFYLSNRLSLSFFSNVFYLFEDDVNCSSGVDRAAALICSALNFQHQDLELTRYLFSTARIPGAPKDKIRKWEEQSHLIIAVLGHFYKLELEQAHSSQSVHQLKNTLVSIVQDALSSKPAPAMGRLTALPRERWSQVYEQLLYDPINREILETINSALLFIAIDLNTFPKNREEKVSAIAHENTENRWYDKSHQIVVFGNGKAGINRDHTMVDGHPTATYISEVFKEAINIAVKLRTGKNLKASIYNFKKLTWDINHQLDTEILQAVSYIQAELEKREIISFDVHQVGPNYSDAMVQIAIQLAAYTYFGKLMSVSEAVHMRHFEQGRYDTIWCVTKESKKFIKAATRKNQVLVNLQKLLNLALVAHKKLVQDCKSGNSPVLHLTALISLLALPGFSKLVDCQITTSNPGAKPGYELGGFTDTSPGVIGISYIIAADQIQVCIKADHPYLGCAEGLKKSLTQSLQLIGSLNNRY